MPPCLPRDWDNTLEYGVATQFWGSTPRCNTESPECTDKLTGKAVCCTRNCQVLGHGKTKITPMDASNPKGGLFMTFEGAYPAPDDPFWCVMCCVRVVVCRGVWC